MMCKRFVEAVRHGEITTKRFQRKRKGRYETLTLYSLGGPDGDVLLACPYCGEPVPDADKVQPYVEEGNHDA